MPDALSKIHPNYTDMPLKKALDELVHKGFSDTLGKGLNGIFSIAGFLKLYIDGVNSEHPEKTVASWLNFSSGLVQTWARNGEGFEIGSTLKKLPLLNN